MKMNNKTYDILKYIAQIVLPALGAFYAALVPLWGLPYGKEVVGTIAALDTLLGALLLLSSKKYYAGDKDVNGYIEFDGPEEEMTIDLSDIDWSQFTDGSRVVLKVKGDETYQGKHEG